MMSDTQIATTRGQPGAAPAPNLAQYQGPFSHPEAFERSMKMARALASSPLVPRDYRGDENLGSVLIALDMASRLQANPLMVMQNLYVVEGRPSWSAQFLIATINSSQRFTPLRFVLSEPGDEVTREVVTGYDWDNSGHGKGRRVPRTGQVTYRRRECYATCRDIKTGEALDGPVVSMDMAAAEGWLGKSGSKWQSMPEVMLRYRAAAFWARAYSPETAMGIQTAEEVHDTIDVTPDADGVYARQPSVDDLNASLLASVARAPDKSGNPGQGAGEAQTPKWPRPDPQTGELLDVRGCPWIEQAHSANRTCTADGTWRMKRGADPDLVKRLEAEAMSSGQDETHDQASDSGALEMHDPGAGEPGYRARSLPAENHEPSGAQDGAPSDAAESDEDASISDFERVRRGLASAPDEQALDEWWDYSRSVVISHSQRMAIEAAAEERKRQIADSQR
ncbi:hypothetical protein [Thiococcus pfennigii]|uniref:hypothetical protein n=1 Tax=Thiococcus pfennigii TaxID=1057 RepID=UPI0019036351|nr:hypothetical protein [Thiococcus pfennigii]MBK1699776.1 hypothetical protein [Thiococcus pfennigii]